MSEKSTEKISFFIDKDKLKLKEKILKQRFIFFSIIIPLLLSVIFYFPIGTENFPIFLLITAIVSFIFIYATYIGVRNAKRIWEKFSIVLSKNNIEWCYDLPIYNEFEKTKWNRNSQKIAWGNVILISSKKIILIDKSIPYLKRSLFGQGKIKIPKEIIAYEKLISEINKKIVLEKNDNSG